MARKRRSGVNVSAAIRKYLDSNSDVGPKAAAEALSKELGQPVTATYVSNIKGLMKDTGKKKARRARKAQSAAPAARSASQNGSVQLATIEAVKAIIEQVGADTAKQLIDLLA